MSKLKERLLEKLKEEFHLPCEKSFDQVADEVMGLIEEEDEFKLSDVLNESIKAAVDVEMRKQAKDDYDIVFGLGAYLKDFPNLKVLGMPFKEHCVVLLKRKDHETYSIGLFDSLEEAREGMSEKCPNDVVRRYVNITFGSINGNMLIKDFD